MLTLNIFRALPPDEEFFSSLFESLHAELEGRLSPEFVDTLPPAREPLEEVPLGRIASWVTEPGEMLFFRRIASMEMEGFVSFDAFPKNPCPTGVSLSFPSESLDEQSHEVLGDVLSRLCERVGAGYGFLATTEDRRAQNSKRGRTRDGDLLETRTDDDLGKGLPGLYWLNWFGPTYRSELDADKARSLARSRVEVGSSGTLIGYQGVTGHSDYSTWQSEMRETLGESLFVDIDDRKKAVRVPWPTR